MKVFTRRDGRILLIAAGMLLLLAGFRLWLPHSPEASLPLPLSLSRPAEYQELEAEEELWYEWRRWRNGNWIWEPTEGELAAHEGLLFVAPIVDAEGKPVIADVYVNGEPQARTDVVALLMWDTEARPVTLDVVEEGYHPWSMSFRARLKLEDGEVRRLEGEIRLERERKE